MGPRSWLHRSPRRVSALVAAVPDGRTLTLAVPAEVAERPPVLRIGSDRVVRELVPGSGSPARWQTVVDLSELAGEEQRSWPLELSVGSRRLPIHAALPVDPSPPAPVAPLAQNAFVLHRARRGAVTVRRIHVEPRLLVRSVLHAPGLLVLRLDETEPALLARSSVQFRHARSGSEVQAAPRLHEGSWQVRVPVEELVAVGGAPSAWAVSGVSGGAAAPVLLRGLRSQDGMARVFPWMPHLQDGLGCRVRPRLAPDGSVRVAVQRVVR